MNNASFTIENIANEIDRIARQERELTEKALAEAITKYDFIVGSKEVKHKLTEVLPEGANVVCSPYIADTMSIYMVKKFDISELLSKIERSE